MKNIRARRPSRAVIERTLKSIGFTPDSWQLDIIMRSLEEPVLGVSVARQNGKTELAEMRAFIAALRGDGVLMTAHNGDLSRAQAKRGRAIAEPLRAQGLVSEIVSTVNRNEIDFTSGGRIVFKIRSSNSVAVGLSLDLIIVDEAQKLSQDEWEGLAATTTASPRRSTLMIGTPPTDEDLERVGMGGPFISQREKGGSGWIEFGVGDYTPGHNPWTAKDWHGANPAWHRIPDFAGVVRGERATMDDERFARQRLGAWVLPTMGELHEPELTTAEARKILGLRGPAQSAYLHAGLGITPDCQHAYLTFSDGAYFEVIKEISVEGGGLEDVGIALSQLARRYYICQVPANARGKAVVELLTRTGQQRKLALSTMPMTATAIMSWYRGARGGQIKIFNSDLSAMALGSAWIGFDSRSGSSTIEAADPDVKACMLSIVLAGGQLLQGVQTPDKSSE